MGQPHVEGHGGQIDIASVQNGKEDRGTTVRVSLPISTTCDEGAQYLE